MSTDHTNTLKHGGIMCQCTVKIISCELRKVIDLAFIVDYSLIK